MKRLLLSFLVFGFFAADAFGQAASFADSDEIRREGSLRYVKRALVEPGVTMRLVFFHTSEFRLRVIDNGGGDRANYDSIESAFLRNDCVAGVNGGFFLRDQQPSGLMISDGAKVGRFTMGSKLLSGVVYADDRGIHLLRKVEFRSNAGITALIQTGPFLVDQGRTVSGLSAEPARRRSFIATDYRGNWVLGQTDAISLADLGAALATAGNFPEFPVNRAINLDGGTSCGFFFEGGDGRSNVSVSPFKRVRNYVGISRK